MSDDFRTRGRSSEQGWSFEPLTDAERSLHVPLGPEMPLALMSRSPSPAPPSNPEASQEDQVPEVEWARYSLSSHDGGKEAARQITAKVCNEGVEPPSRALLDKLHSSGEEDLAAAITTSSDFTVDNCAEMLKKDLRASEAKRLLDKWIMVSRMEPKHFNGVPLGNLRQVLFESLQTASDCYRWRS